MQKRRKWLRADFLGLGLTFSGEIYRNCTVVFTGLAAVLCFWSALSSDVLRQQEAEGKHSGGGGGSGLSCFTCGAEGWEFIVFYCTMMPQAACIPHTAGVVTSVRKEEWGQLGTRSFICFPLICFVPAFFPGRDVDYVQNCL